MILTLPLFSTAGWTLLKQGTANADEVSPPHEAALQLQEEGASPFRAPAAAADRFKMLSPTGANQINVVPLPFAVAAVVQPESPASASIVRATVLQASAYGDAGSPHAAREQPRVMDGAPDER